MAKSTVAEKQHYNQVKNYLYPYNQVNYYNNPTTKTLSRIIYTTTTKSSIIFNPTTKTLSRIIYTHTTKSTTHTPTTKSRIIFLPYNTVNYSTPRTESLTHTLTTPRQNLSKPLLRGLKILPWLPVPEPLKTPLAGTQNTSLAPTTCNYSAKNLPCGDPKNFHRIFQRPHEP